MQEFVIKQQGEQKWARIEKASKAKDGGSLGDRVVWVGVETASRFPSAQKAIESYKGAIADMERVAEAKAAKLNDNPEGGEMINFSQARARKKSRLWENLYFKMSEEQRIAFGGHANPWGAQHSAKLAIPSYAWEHKPRWMVNGPVKVEAEALAGKSAMMEPLDIFFVRSDRGWLGHSDKGRVWASEFHLAKSFFSKQQAVLSGIEYGGGDISVVSAKMSLDNVEPAVAGSPMDGEAKELAAMCIAAREAREIKEVAGSDSRAGSPDSSASRAKKSL